MKVDKFRYIIQFVLISWLIFMIQACQKTEVGNVGLIWEVAPNPTMQSQVMVVNDKQPYYGSGSSVVRTFDSNLHLSTEFKNLLIGEPRDVTVDSNRNQLLIAGFNHVRSVDLITGALTTISDRDQGKGPLYETKHIIYDPVSDTVLGHHGNPNILDIIYSIDLATGDRNEIHVFNRYLLSLALDIPGRRLFALYKPELYHVGVLQYDLQTGTETILLDTQQKIGDYTFSTELSTTVASLTYSAKQNTAYFILNNSVFGLDITSGEVNRIGEKYFLQLTDEYSIDEAHILNDQLYVIISRIFTELTGSSDTPTASYLFLYDEVSDKFINKEQARWDEENQHIRAAIRNSYIILFEYLFGPFFF